MKLSTKGRYAMVALADLDSTRGATAATLAALDTLAAEAAAERADVRRDCRRQRGKQIGQRLVRLCGEIGLWRVGATGANRQLAGNEYEAAGSDRVGIVAARRRGISRIGAADLQFTSH